MPNRSRVPYAVWRRLRDLPPQLPTTSDQSSSRLPKWLQWTRFFANKSALTVVIVCIVGFIVINRSALTGIVVEPVSLPKSLLDAGFTPEGTGDELTEQLQLASSDSEWARFVQQPVLRPADLPEVPGIETKKNTRAIVRFVRDLIGLDRNIRAEIREVPPRFEMVLRVADRGGQRVVSCQLERAAFEAGLKECAHQAIRVMNPALFLLLAFTKETTACGLKDGCSFAETRAFAGEMLRSRDSDQEKWARTILALVQVGEGNSSAAEQSLQQVVGRYPNFFAGRFVLALTENDNKKAIVMLRDVAAKAPDLVGVNSELFRRLLNPGILGPEPTATFLKADSPEARELETIVHRVESTPGSTAEYYARRMRAALSCRTGRTLGAMDILNDLRVANPKDASVLVDLGDVHWVQSYIESTGASQSKSRGRAAGYYRAATKIAPEWRLPAEKLKDAASRLEDQLDVLKGLAATEPTADYSPILVAAAAKACDIETFAKQASLIAETDPGRISAIKDYGSEVGSAFREQLYRVSVTKGNNAARTWCVKNVKEGYTDSPSPF